jgi:hypothetical protein
MNLVLLKAGQIDTSGVAPQVTQALRQADSTASSLHLVQLAGPPTPDAMRILKASGAKRSSHVPNNSFLIWATRSQRGIAPERVAGVLTCIGGRAPFIRLISSILGIKPTRLNRFP